MDAALGQVGTPMRTYGLRFDVNCSILFTELPLLARPAAAKAAGVRHLPSSLVAGAPRSSAQTAGRAFGSRAEL